MVKSFGIFNTLFQWGNFFPNPSRAYRSLKMNESRILVCDFQASSCAAFLVFPSKQSQLKLILITLHSTFLNRTRLQPRQFIKVFGCEKISRGLCASASLDPTPPPPPFIVLKLCVFFIFCTAYLGRDELNVVLILNRCKWNSRKFKRYVQFVVMPAILLSGINFAYL